MTEHIVWGGSISDGGGQYGYIRFYDLAADPVHPPIVGREKLAEAFSGIPGRVAIWGDNAYVSTVMVGLQVVSISKAKAHNNQASDGSSIVGVYDSMGPGYGSPNDIFIYGPGKALLTTNPGHLIVLDINNPVPVLMGLLEPSKGYALRAAGMTDYSFVDASGNPQVMDLAVISGREKIKTVDLSDPYNPKVLATVKDADGNEVSITAYDITLNKAMGLAITSSGTAIQIIDIKDPYHPRLINSITQLADTSGTATPDGTPSMIPIGFNPVIVESNGWLYTAEANEGMKTVDLGGKLKRRCKSRDCDP